jgi:uroporphyrinogen-III synthase
VLTPAANCAVAAAPIFSNCRDVRLLVTRPQPAAARTAAALRARGHEAIIAPLTWIEILSQADLGAGPWTAFLLTSVHALWGLANQTHRAEVRSVPVFTVGEATARAVRQHGFTNVASADGTVTDLANLVAARLQPPARILYLAGEDRAGDLAGDLRAWGFIVDMVVVYRAVTAQRLPPEAMSALSEGIDGVLHYSRGSAEAYLEAARRSGALAGALRPAHLCLSSQAAEPLVQAGAPTIQVAPKPNEAALLGLLGPATH